MSQLLLNERIVLGVTGGIAAYKTAELVRRLRQAGAEVRVVMTEAAGRFITATTLQALSGHPVRSSLWDEAAEAAMGHIELARWASRVLVAPASADTLARLAQGRADDLLATLCLATTAPLALAPAMNHRMWLHPATQANLATLRERGASVIGPDSGDQACGETGPGRMSDPEAIVAALAGNGAAAAIDGDRLAGLRLVISAGPTFEDIDPVRFLGNRSSGKMGFALAGAAAAMGAHVCLVAGPVALPTPRGVDRTDVRSAAQMHAAVMQAVDGCDAYIGAAAVADYAPVQSAPEKIKKHDATLTLSLQRTRDILAEVSALQPRPFVLGFAAETSDLERYARDKLESKRLDLIAANRVGTAEGGFEADNNQLEVYWADGHASIGPAPKTDVAVALLQLLARRLQEARR